MGRRDLPGRPIVYGTTKAFLELFGLNTLSDLPTLKEIQPPPAPEEISPQEIMRDEMLKTEIEETASPQDLPINQEEE
jgi:segregation and condensation protein B